MEKTNITKHIGNKFQEYRLKNNLTQNQVAEITGLEPRHISQIERGLSKGSIDTLLKLCNAYKITPDIILYDLLDEDLKKMYQYTQKISKNWIKKIKKVYYILLIIFFQDKTQELRFCMPCKPLQNLFSAIFILYRKLSHYDNFPKI